MSVQERVFDQPACSTPLEKFVERTAGAETSEGGRAVSPGKN